MTWNDNMAIPLAVLGAVYFLGLWWDERQYRKMRERQERKAIEGLLKSLREVRRDRRSTDYHIFMDQSESESGRDSVHGPRQDRDPG